MADSRRQARSTYDDEYDLSERSVVPRESLSVMDTESEEDPVENMVEFGSTSFSRPSSPTCPLPPRPLPPIPTNAVTVRRLANARRWEWMPEVLEGWRRTEGIPTRPEVPGSFPPIPSLTEEPVHETIPILVARMHTLEQRFRRLELSDTETEDEETHNSEVTRLQHQLEEDQRRIAQLEEEVAALRADRDRASTSRRSYN